MKYVQGLLYMTSFIIAVNSYNSKLPRNYTTEDRFARIMGGYRPKEFLYAQHIVSLRYGEEQGVFGSNHVCGGSIITERIVLTAAHCLTNIKYKRYLKVVIGSTDRIRLTGKEQILGVSKIIQYPVFDYKTGYGDIALLHLAERIVEDGVRVRRINLTEDEPKPGLRCIFFGWGGVVFNGPLADELVYMNVTVLPVWHCSIFSPMAHGMLCVGAIFGPQKVAANGDSGGPLICDGKLVGVASYIAAIRTYFGSVYYYKEWIEANSKSLPIKSLEPLKILAVSLLCILVF